MVRRLEPSRSSRRVIAPMPQTRPRQNRTTRGVSPLSGTSDELIVSSIFFAIQTDCQWSQSAAKDENLLICKHFSVSLA